MKWSVILILRQSDKESGYSSAACLHHELTDSYVVGISFLSFTSEKSECEIIYYFQLNHQNYICYDDDAVIN